MIDAPPVGEAVHDLQAEAFVGSIDLNRFESASTFVVHFDPETIRLDIDIETHLRTGGGGGMRDAVRDELRDQQSRGLIEGRQLGFDGAGRSECISQGGSSHARGVEGGQEIGGVVRHVAFRDA